MKGSMKKLLALGLLSALLAGCGGGGGGSTSPGGGVNPPPPPSIPPSSQSAQQCAPDNPYIADAKSPTSSGSIDTEKQFIRSYFDENYLWYDSVPTVDPNASTYTGSLATLDGYGVPQPLGKYFAALKSPLLTPSGAKLDKFSFAYPTKKWNDMSQGGVTAGYGIEWATINSTSPNRLWRVASVQPGSPAAQVGILRGDTLKTVDGVDFANGTDTNALNGGLFPTTGTVHSFAFSRSGSSDIAVQLTATTITIDPVPTSTVITAAGGRKVGYLVFTDHIASAEDKLITAVKALKTSQVQDLVLDLRYNGGGYLFLASELSYMIAGSAKTSGKYFEKLQYNAKRTADNAKEATPFYNMSCILNSNFDCTRREALPTLDLSRVFIITTADTCSASESIINGLRGLDVDVQLIGSTTCGKPYGFTAKDNCGISYFPIEFKGTNAKGFGDYADGFSPTTGTTSNTSLAGCPTTDDLDHALGNTSERMLAAALQKATAGTCPAPTVAARMSATGTPLTSRLLRDNPARESRILLPAQR